ncbi:transposase [Orientia tsutsugamushi]|uniref:Transposase n=1 Tax=Orientia tsutsugamushi TaxID=784 RepID=A0A2U3RS58_ORITS|nr:putative transposase [Orientia tsutsugamushi str. Karp]SPR16075.1 transposase [Orientia tsutsugamushi]
MLKLNDHVKNNKDLLDKSALLVLILDVGAKTQAIVLACLVTIEKFNSGKQVVAFVGLILSIINLVVLYVVLVKSLELLNLDLRKAFK